MRAARILNRVRCSVITAIPQVQMAARLLHADKIEPWRRIGSESHACDESRAGRRHVSSSHLRGYREEELIDRAIGQEFAEEGRTAFMEQQRYAELAAQK